MEVTDVKKITSKLMVGNTKTADYGELYSVIGLAINVQTGTTSFGEWTALVGEFEAWNDKMRVRSNKLFLPEVASIPITLALAKGDSVEFGIIVSKIEAENAVGFEYTVKNIIPSKQNSALNDLKTKFITYNKKEVKPEKNKF